MSSTARLRIIQVTDCYTLVNFPSLKTLIQQKRAEMAGTQFNGNAFWVKSSFLATYEAKLAHVMFS